jgi:hypothetical protein
VGATANPGIHDLLANLARPCVRTWSFQVLSNQLDPDLCMVASPRHLPAAHAFLETLNTRRLEGVICVEALPTSVRTEEERVRKRLPAVIIILSLIFGCGGEQETRTLAPAPISRATHTLETTASPTETPARATAGLPPSPLAATSPPEPMATAAPVARSGLIPFTSERDGNAEIYVKRADGSDPRRLTHDPAYDGWPTWSPDGSRIAFSSTRSGNPDIYVLDVYGAGHGSGNPRPLTDHPASDIWPEWSPDRTRIAFPSNRQGNFEIYVMYADGANLQRLTSTDTAEDSPPGPLTARRSSSPAPMAAPGRT